jgi:hypothetical protein
MAITNIIRSIGSLREGSRSAGGWKVLFCKLVSGLGFIFGAGLGWLALFSSGSVKMQYWHPELFGVGDVAVFDSHWWGLIFIVGMGCLIIRNLSCRRCLVLQLHVHNQQRNLQ